MTKSLETDPDTERLIEADENHIFSAQFLGFYKDAPEQYWVEIDYDPTSHVVSASFSKVTQTPELIIGASGRNETVIEVVSGATPFGRSELKKWEKVRLTIPEQDRDARWAMKLVELTIEHNPHREEVGGPIDALEITDAGIRWIQRKSQCSDKPETIPPDVRKVLESE